MDAVEAPDTDRSCGWFGLDSEDKDVAAAAAAACIIRLMLGAAVVPEADTDGPDVPAVPAVVSSAKRLEEEDEEHNDVAEQPAPVGKQWLPLPPMFPTVDVFFGGFCCKDASEVVPVLETNGEECAGTGVVATDEDDDSDDVAGRSNGRRYRVGVCTM